MKPLDEEPQPHDAHVQQAHKLFRASCVTLAAMQYPRTPAAFQALCDWNNLKDPSKAPFPWRFHPNAALRDKWLATGRL
jgi:hypothetical protein